MTADSDAQLKLYHGRASTCSKKVRMVLYEKQLSFTSCLLDLQKFEHLTPAYLKLNPNGVVPTLVHRGRPVIESNVIVEYLDETFPQIPLVPADPFERAQMRVITRFADTFAYNAVYMLSWMRLSAPAARQLSAEQLRAILRAVPTEERRSRWRTVAGEGFTPAEIADSQRKMAETLTQVETWLDHGGPWLLADRYSLADIAIVPFVDRIDTLLPELLAGTPYSRTRDWFKRMQNRAAFPSALRFTEDPRAANLPSI